MNKIMFFTKRRIQAKCLTALGGCKAFQGIQANPIDYGRHVAAGPVRISNSRNKREDTQ